MRHIKVFFSGNILFYFFSFQIIFYFFSFHDFNILHFVFIHNAMYAMFWESSLVSLNLYQQRTHAIFQNLPRSSFCGSLVFPSLLCSSCPAVAFSSPASPFRVPLLLSLPDPWDLWLSSGSRSEDSVIRNVPFPKLVPSGSWRCCDSGLWRIPKASAPPTVKEKERIIKRKNFLEIFLFWERRFRTLFHLMSIKYARSIYYTEPKRFNCSFLQ